MITLKRILSAWFALFLVISLSGCIQLAKEDAGGNAKQDLLIGIFITQEHLDLFDTESYLNDYLSGKVTKDPVIIDTTNNKYQGRLYAALTERILTDEVTGRPFHIREFVFEDIKGIPFFSARIPEGLNDPGFTSTGSDRAISDGHSALHYGDDEESTSLEGTLYIPAENQDIIHYINPVYQSADGSVYAVSGNGHMIGGISSEGTVYTQTLEENVTTVENGHEKRISLSVKISLSIIIPPEKINLSYMSKDHTMLLWEEYAPGQLPNSLVPEADTEYIIVETIKKDDQGRQKTTRTLVDKNNNNFETFFLRDDGYCVKQWTQLEWLDVNQSDHISEHESL